MTDMPVRLGSKIHAARNTRNDYLSAKGRPDAAGSVLEYLVHLGNTAYSVRLCETAELEGLVKSLNLYAKRARQKLTRLFKSSSWTYATAKRRNKGRVPDMHAEFLKKGIMFDASGTFSWTFAITNATVADAASDRALVATLSAPYASLYGATHSPAAWPGSPFVTWNLKTWRPQPGSSWGGTVASAVVEACSAYETGATPGAIIDCRTRFVNPAATPGPGTGSSHLVDDGMVIDIGDGSAFKLRGAGSVNAKPDGTNADDPKNINTALPPSQTVKVLLDPSRYA